MVFRNRFSYLACIVVFYLMAEFACVQGLDCRKGACRRSGPRGIYGQNNEFVDTEGNMAQLQELLTLILSSQSNGGGGDLTKNLIAPWMLQDPMLGPLIEMYLKARMR